MKKTNKVKMGPLGTPLGNPLGYFNSLRDKRTPEPKQTFKFGGLRKKECGGDTGIPCPETKPNIISASGTLGNSGVSVGGKTTLGENGPTNSMIGANYAKNDIKAGASYNFDNNDIKGGFTKTNPNGSILGVNGTYSTDNNGLGLGASYTTKTGGKWDASGNLVDGRPSGSISYTSGPNAVIPGVRIGVGSGSGFTMQKKGGAVKSKKKLSGATGSHRMPNGKMMLNSAMKKRTFKKK